VAGCTGTPTIAFFNADATTITAGGSTTLRWGAVTNADTVDLQHVLTEEPILLPAAALVLAQGHQAVTALADELAAAPGFAAEVHLVGDCLAPRTVEEAVLEGLTVGTAL
jgi:hypothetical protein